MKTCRRQGRWEYRAQRRNHLGQWFYAINQSVTASGYFGGKATEIIRTLKQIRVYQPSASAIKRSVENDVDCRGGKTIKHILVTKYWSRVQFQTALIPTLSTERHLKTFIVSLEMSISTLSYTLLLTICFWLSQFLLNVFSWTGPDRKEDQTRMWVEREAQFGNRTWVAATGHIAWVVSTGVGRDTKPTHTEEGWM